MLSPVGAPSSVGTMLLGAPLSIRGAIRMDTSCYPPRFWNLGDLGDLHAANRRARIPTNKAACLDKWLISMFTFFGYDLH
jgi:hypothetical protein